jgi:hypothetical protein
VTLEMTTWKDLDYIRFHQAFVVVVVVVVVVRACFSFFDLMYLRCLSEIVKSYGNTSTTDLSAPVRFWSWPFFLLGRFWQ